MIDKWKKTIHKHQAHGDLLTDLSKLFHCLNQNIRIAKLHSYGISLSLLMNGFLISSSIIVHLYGCFTAAHLKK